MVITNNNNNNNNNNANGNELDQEDEFGLGLTIDELISHLTELRNKHGNLHTSICVGGEPPMYVLDHPAVMKVRQNMDKSCYEPDSNGSLQVVVFEF